MWIGKQIEITHITPALKRVGMIIHLFCRPEDAALPRNGQLCQELVRRGNKYLIDEGFLPDNTHGWQVDIGGLVHGDNTSTT
jgi:hypothetical protein